MINKSYSTSRFSGTPAKFETLVSHKYFGLPKLKRKDIFNNLHFAFVTVLRYPSV